MFKLNYNERQYLLELLDGSFDNIISYFLLAHRFDVLRLLLSNSPLFILKPWDCNIDLTILGHKETRPIVFIDTNYQVVKEFDYHPIFGELEEHIQWLNDYANGQQVYLRIEQANNIQSILCLIVNQLPPSTQKQIVNGWLDNIKWSINSYRLGEILLAYPGEHKLIIYRLSSPFNSQVTRDDIINNPSTEIIDITSTNVLTFYKFQTGFYLFKEILPNGEQWLKMENLEGDLATNYRYINGVNYLGYTRNIQISLNIQENSDINKVIKRPDFKLRGDLVVDEL